MLDCLSRQVACKTGCSGTLFPTTSPNGEEMKLIDFLAEKRPAILKKWLEKIIETYPADSSFFLSRQKDQFTNPIGHTIRQGAEALFDALRNEADIETMAPFLDGIIRIKAVQEGLPSNGVSFIFALKAIIRETLGQSIKGDDIAQEFLQLESRIDSVALLAFDNFMKCREKIYELKANETRNMTFRLLQKARILSEIPGEESAPEQQGSDKPTTKEGAK
jgi:hypothetical protein